VSINLYTGVRLKADADNTDVIYVGFHSSVLSTTGWALAAGDELPVPVDDPTKLWVIAGAASQTLYWLAM
jgi:hypothetical protein